MRLLLDTHALLWWAAGDERLSADARCAIGSSVNEIFVSAASAWEIATKVRIGKLPSAAPLLAALPSFLADQGFAELPIRLAHALDAGNLPGPHRDPFDRMLIAQALQERLVLVGNDTIFDIYGVQRLW